MTTTRSSFFISAAAIAFIIIAPLVALAAWSEPSQAPTGGNPDAPINTGSSNQVKNGGLSVNGFSVFGNTSLNGNTYLKVGVTGSIYRYLNFSANYDVNGIVIASTVGTNGYGIRDKDGTLEFKNSGGSWASIQSTVQNLTGITSAVSTTTFSNGINVPSGCIAVKGVCITSGTSYWAASGSNIYNTNTGNVGVGTANPSKKLDVQGDINVSGNQYVNGVKAYLFGGLYVTASVYCPAINNALTGGLSCPSGFTAQLVFGALCNASDPAVRSIYMCVK